ncbi:MAG: retroviral-like aspartic protease family protein [Gemmataceae bacterium]|nr:retroviral-like aspartic protease family protein [Gemmataceae bacterium]
MPESPAPVYRVPLRPATTRLVLDLGPPERSDPVPVLTYRALAALLLVRADGGTEEEFFRVDSGAGTSLMSLARAEELGIRTTGRRGKVKLTTAAAERYEDVVVGVIRVRFPGSDRLFLRDCLFVADRPKAAPSLLGLKDVIQSLKVTIDRTPAAGAPDGSILFEDYPPAPAG